MTSPLWRTGLDAARAQFEAELQSRGFVLGEAGWNGSIEIPISPSGTYRTRKAFVVSIPDDFPFAPPKVRAETPPSSLTWHHSPDGSLCLYRIDNEPSRPWESVQELFDRVFEWSTRAQAQWPDDPGDPDLARYFKRSELDVVVEASDLDALVGRLLVKIPRTCAGAQVWGYRPRAGGDRGYKEWARCVDIGTLKKPVHSWKTILDRLDNVTKQALQQDVGLGRSGVLIARYARAGTEGARTAAVALRIQAARGSEPRVSVMDFMDTSPARLSIRAGADSELVADRTVAVVGVGAIGSFAADLLARSGVGSLVLVDGDRLYAENCVRHLADASYAPMPKVEAVRRILTQRYGTSVTAYEETLKPARAIELLQTADVVIDATANSAVHSMLEYLAEVVGECKLVKVALQRDGEVVRVDRIEGGDARHCLPRLEKASRQRPVVHRDTGCGDPISPSTPWAVMNAAAIAVRYTIDFLRPRMRRKLTDSVIEVLLPQSDLAPSAVTSP